MIKNGWTKKIEQLETELAKTRKDLATLVKAAKAARHVLNAVEVEEWMDGGPETMPQAEELREAIRSIEE